MSISSLGVGSGILTQDVLDQLRKADESGKLTPVTLSIAHENDKKESFKLVDERMTNFIDSVNDIKSQSVWNERTATVTSGSSISVSAVEKTDLQDFTIEVITLATKQIERSGAFTTATDVVDTAAGSFDISVGGGTAVSINYSAGATLTDIKNLINNDISSPVNATIVQINSGEFRLFLNSSDTGASKDIKIISFDGLDTKLTTEFDLAAVRDAGDAAFTFNGEAFIRSSNKVDDLIVGLSMTLTDVGTSEVSITQDRTSIFDKFDNFVSKYNESLTELNSLTAVSIEASERGIFSNDSLIKGLKRTMQDLLDSVGGGVGAIMDYGFDIDRDGKLSLDKTLLGEKFDAEPKNTQAFFSGGDFTKSDGSIVSLSGVFSEIATRIESYTKTGAMLDSFSEGLTQKVSDLEERKLQVIARLDAKYEILKKQYTAYDLIINRINSTSDIFTQLVAQNNNN